MEKEMTMEHGHGHHHGHTHHKPHCGYYHPCGCDITAGIGYLGILVSQWFTVIVNNFEFAALALIVYMIYCVYDRTLDEANDGTPALTVSQLLSEHALVIWLLVLIAIGTLGYAWFKNRINFAPRCFMENCNVCCDPCH